MICIDNKFYEIEDNKAVRNLYTCTSDLNISSFYIGNMAYYILTEEGQVYYLNLLRSPIIPRRLECPEEPCMIKMLACANDSILMLDTEGRLFYWIKNSEFMTKLELSKFFLTDEFIVSICGAHTDYLILGNQGNVYMWNHTLFDGKELHVLNNVKMLSEGGSSFCGLGFITKENKIVCVQRPCPEQPLHLNDDNLRALSLPQRSCEIDSVVSSGDAFYVLYKDGKLYFSGDNFASSFENCTKISPMFSCDINTSIYATDGKNIYFEPNVYSVVDFKDDQTVEDSIQTVMNHYIDSFANKSERVDLEKIDLSSVEPQNILLPNINYTSNRFSSTKKAEC